MKHIKKFESKYSVEDYFEITNKKTKYQGNFSSVPDKFPDLASEYFIFDDIYLYDSKLYKFTNRGVYGTLAKIELIEKTPNDYINELHKKLDDIEKAILKLEHNHDL